MAISYSYPRTLPKNGDLLLLSRLPSDPTKTSNYNVSVKELATFINPAGAGTGTGNYLPIFETTASGTILSDSVLFQDDVLNPTSISIGTAAVPINATITGDLTLNGNLTDNSGTTDLNVVNVNNVFTVNNATAQPNVMSGGLNIFGGATFNGDVKFGSGPFYDSTNTVGGAEQVLVSQTDGTLAWENYQGSGLEFQGSWNADTDVPDLTAIVLTPGDTGKYWVVNVAGTTPLPGTGGVNITDWQAGDWAIIAEDISGNIFWEKIDNSSALTGNGTINKISKWDSNNSLGNSRIEDDGTTITMPGADMTDVLMMLDDKQFQLGTNNNMEIYHDSVASENLFNSTSGKLIIRQSDDDKDIAFESDDGAGATTEYFRIDGGSVQNIFSKQVISIAGSEASPSYSFTGESTKGMYSRATNDIGFRATSLSLVTDATSSDRHISLGAVSTDIQINIGDGKATPYNTGSLIIEGIDKTTISQGLTAINSTLDIAYAINATPTDGGDFTLTSSNGIALTLSNDKKLKLNEYGGGTVTGTATYSLQVDSLGNVIEGALNPSGVLTGITAGTGITVDPSAAPSPTVNLDYVGTDNAILAAGAGTPVAADTVWFSDSDDDTIKKALVSSLPFNNYTLPVATASDLGGVKIGYTPTSGTYAVELLNDQMFVTVPVETGTVSTVSSTVAGNALLVNVTNPSTTPAIAFTWDGASTDYIDGEGNKTAFPTIPQGDITEVTTTSPITGGGSSGSVDIGHAAQADTETTTTDTLSFSGTFDVYTGVTTNATGHVSGHEVTTFTMPANPNTNTTYSLGKAAASTDLILKADGTAQDTITFSGTSNEVSITGSAENAYVFGLPDDVTVAGELTVSGTGQSSFGGQVTVPATPSAATDAASKSYVLSQVGGLGTFQGGYDAGSNPGSPAITGGSNIAVGQGDFYTVTVAGAITFSDSPTGDATLEVGDFIFANSDITAGSSPASTAYTLVLADQNIAGAGSTDANTAKGIAGFNSSQFSVSATGWVQSKFATSSVPGISYITGGTGITATYDATSGEIDIAADNNGTVTGVTGTAPIVSSGGVAPAISIDTMGAASAAGGGAKGAVPSSATGDQVKFLRGDATWATPSTGPNDFLTALSFDTTTGVLTGTVSNQTNPTVDLDGRYALSSGNVSGGGTLNKVVKFTNTSSTAATIGDGPITFGPGANDSTFGGNVIIQGNVNMDGYNITDVEEIQFDQGSNQAIIASPSATSLEIKGANVSITGGGSNPVDGTLTVSGIVGMGSTGIYAGAAAQLNLPGIGLAIKNDKNGSDNNWSYIYNTGTSSQANLDFVTGSGTALTLNHDKSATFTGPITSSGSGSAGRITGAQGIFGTTFALTSNGYATFGSTSSSIPIALAIDGDGANPALLIATNDDATFAGSVDVGTLTLSGSAVIADVGMTLQVDGGTTNSITMDNAGTVTFGYYTYFPNYLFHEGDTDTYIQFLTNRILFSAGNTTRIDLNDNGENYWNGVTNFANNIIVDATVDGDNYTINGSQGTSGQVMTSTGSGVQWSTPATVPTVNNPTITLAAGTNMTGGGSFTLNQAGAQTITFNASGGGGSSLWSTGTNSSINYTSGRVGVNLAFPKSALHVEGAVKQTSINVSEQGFFTDETEPYWKAGAYGKGSFFGKAGGTGNVRSNLAQTYAGYASGGKALEVRRSSLTVIPNSAWPSINGGVATPTGQVQLTNKKSNNIIIPYSVTVGMRRTSLSGSASWGTHAYPIQLAIVGGSFGGNRSGVPWTVIGGIPNRILTQLNGNTEENNMRFYQIPFDYPTISSGNEEYRFWNLGPKPAGSSFFRSNNLVFGLKGTTNIKNNAHLMDMYVEVEYKEYNFDTWKNGYNRKLRNQSSAANSTNTLTYFRGTAQNVASNICSAERSVVVANGFADYWHNGNQLQPQVNDSVWTDPNFSSGLANGTYYLYSAGGKRYYIVVANSSNPGLPNQITQLGECAIPIPSS